MGPKRTRSLGTIRKVQQPPRQLEALHQPTIHFCHSLQVVHSRPTAIRWVTSPQAEATQSVDHPKTEVRKGSTCTAEIMSPQARPVTWTHWWILGELRATTNVLLLSTRSLFLNTGRQIFATYASHSACSLRRRTKSWRWVTKMTALLWSILSPQLNLIKIFRSVPQARPTKAQMEFFKPALWTRIQSSSRLLRMLALALRTLEATEIRRQTAA